jgi:hypothetical protein
MLLQRLSGPREVLGPNLVGSDLTTYSKGGTATTPTSTTATFPATNDYVGVFGVGQATSQYKITVTASGTGTFSLGVYGSVLGFAVSSFALSASEQVFTVYRTFNGDADRRLVIGRFNADSATGITVTAVSFQKVGG